ncbi:hypothetical protein SLEP1_g31656 [Rubroshorea leprosula]|uniref:Uncharacterized protein n=1 Tax=Rubroshorea leprosula TaxID=152421 RepID=A0AAV5K637_9ROSI|nr:hypothetical protein SLEP1_g31656 [Rubroshorea leprosula]
MIELQLPSKPNSDALGTDIMLWQGFPVESTSII